MQLASDALFRRWYPVFGARPTDLQAARCLLPRRFPGNARRPSGRAFLPRLWVLPLPAQWRPMSDDIQINPFALGTVNADGSLSPFLIGDPYAEYASLA